MPFGRTLHLQLHKVQDLRYGENPHQRAALYGRFFESIEQLHGKELSYNNIVDINAALSLMYEFLEDVPTVAILKHNTPCGVGTARSVADAYRAAYATDPESPFGGILIANRAWTLELAETVDEIFTEVLIAPEFEPEEYRQVLTNRLSERTVIGYAAKRCENVTRCWAARTVVGTSTATWVPAWIALNAARIATSVLP